MGYGDDRLDEVVSIQFLNNERTDIFKESRNVNHGTLPLLFFVHNDLYLRHAIRSFHHGKGPTLEIFLKVLASILFTDQSLHLINDCLPALRSCCFSIPYFPRSIPYSISNAGFNTLIIP